MRVTIKDIAREAGVSHPTVSKALHEGVGVNKETRDKILRLAKQLNYIPNLAAKSLTNTKTKSIGMIWPQSIAGLFVYHLGTKIQQEAYKQGVNVVMSLADAEIGIRTLSQYFVDMIVMWVPYGWRPTHEFLREKDIYNGKLLTIGGVRLDGAYRVNIDRKSGIYSAIKHLVELGHRRITFVGNQSEKMVGFMQGFLEFSLEKHPDYIIEVDEKGEIPEEKFIQMLSREERPTAIITGSQNDFFTFMRMLRRHQLRIPDDFSLITYDDVPEIQLFDISITTIGPSTDKIAYEVMNIYNIKEDQASSQELCDIRIIPEVTVRSSTIRMKQD